MKSATVAETGAVERELSWASSLVQALMSIGLLADSESTKDARRRALERFDELGVPALVLDAETVHYSNEEWRRRFDVAPPPWAQRGVELVLRTGMPLHLPEAIAQSGNRNEWLAATLVPLRVGDTSLCALVCRAMTDDALARELHIPSDACLWSGALATPTVADYCNDRMRSFAGEAFSLGWQSIVYADDVAAWSQALTQAAHQRTSTPCELRLLRVDGTYRWHTVSVIVTSSNTRWFSVAVDSHDERLLESERNDLLARLRAARYDAEQAHKLKDQVLAAVSHELRAPVTTMMLWERVLRDPITDAAARVQALDAIRQSATAQSRLVSDLLDMSRAISGKLYMDIRSVELARIVGEAAQAALPAALAKRITLTHVGDFKGELAGDASRLRQVIDNLLSNAIKFTDSGGRVTVSLQRRGREVVVQVEDSGCGIDESELERIFKPFSQAGHSIAGRASGLGLGLAIAREIAELHHGTLAAFSEGPSRGTCMTLTLPTAGQLRAPSPPAGIVSPRALNEVRVLVIDDDERVRNALQLLLSRAGAAVDCADSASVARATIASTPPQVIVCDIAMPGEDGYTFIRALRASGSKIPAIALTAYASPAHAEEAVSAGFDLHVAKPVDFQRLVASLTFVIDSRR